jgi:hypothetical protein
LSSIHADKKNPNHFQNLPKHTPHCQNVSFIYKHKKIYQKIKHPQHPKNGNKKILKKIKKNEKVRKNEKTREKARKNPSNCL